MNRDLFDRALAPILTKIRLLCSRALIRLTDDPDNLIRLQVERLAGEVSDGVEQFGLFGVTSRPMPGAEAIVVSVNGDRSHPVVIATADRRFTVSLAEGAVAIHDAAGTVVKCNGAGDVEITAARVTISGDLEVAGDVSDGAGSMADMRTAYNGHTHVGNLGSPTSPPTPTQ